MPFVSWNCIVTDRSVGLTVFIDTTVQTTETTHTRMSRITHKRLPCICTFSAPAS